MKKRFILIDDNYMDLQKCSFGFLWAHDSICYNFRRPTEFVLSSEIDSIANDKNVVGVVIGCNLKDYSFLKGLTELEQLYFYNTTELADFSFLESQYKLTQLQIVDSRISDLSKLLSFLKSKEQYLSTLDLESKALESTEGICINSINELDGSLLSTRAFFALEIIVNGKHIRW